MEENVFLLSPSLRTPPMAWDDRQVRRVRTLVGVTALACCAAIAFIAAVENDSAPEQGRRELFGAWHTPWLAKHAHDQSFYYWSDATAQKGEVVVECWGGLRTTSKDASDCGSVFESVFKLLCQ